ncbi:winged helix-turn-helix transcriptional regulator [Candidatus Saccharibacteria bacterium]|nr:winged helix-turn-helix transcriptional regulator [Candidatus Saccharibacteria bacterium]
MKLLERPTVKLNKREERLVSAWQSLGDKTRFKIFKLLLSKKDYCVSEIAEKVGISLPAASQHFRIFELVGLVDKVRYGQLVCYVINKNDPLVQELVKCISG